MVAEAPGIIPQFQSKEWEGKGPAYLSLLSGQKTKQNTKINVAHFWFLPSKTVSNGNVHM